MEKQITLRIGAVLLLAALNFSQAEILPEYFEIGGKLTMRPTVTEIITNILWKFNGNPLAEWVKGDAESFYYNKYQGRTTMSTATGQLEIKNMVKEDVGWYTVEINNKVHGQSYAVKWITKVPKPIVLFRTLTCGPHSESCSVICDDQELYSLRDAEPIQYSWKMGEKNWETMTKDITVTRAQTETESIKTISCRMKNPVSQEDSEPKENPMYTEPEVVDNNSGLIAGVIIFLLVAVVVAVIVVYKFKPELLPGWMPRCRGGSDIEATAVKDLDPARGVPNNPPEAEPKNSPGAETNNSTGAETNNSTGAEPKNSTVAEPKNSTVAEPKNSTVAEPDSSEAEPDSSELQPLNPPDKAADLPTPDN